MLKRIRPSIGSAHVIALLALFAALGGGYAMAFSGSGTLQKGVKAGFPDDANTYTTVRTLNGLGRIEVACAGGNLALQFHNSLDSPVIVDSLVSNGSSGVTSSSDRVESDSETGTDGFLGEPPGGLPAEWWFHYWVHAHPLNGLKRPQADIQVGLRPSQGDCSSASAIVLALNTEE